MIRRSTLFACGILLLCPAVTFAQTTWTGLGDGATWEDPNNWSGNVLPGSTGNNNAHIGGYPTPITLTTSQTINETDIVGDQNAGTAVLNHSAGTLSGNGWFKVGVNGGNDGTYTMTGSAATTGNSQVHLGTRGGTGTINVGDNATFTSTDDVSLARDDPNGVGTLNLSGNGTFTSGDRLNVGTQGTGTINVADDATLNFQNFNSSNGGGTAVVNQTGGTINSNSWVAIGQGNTLQPNGGGIATFNHSGGTLNVALTDSEFLTIGENGSGVYNASGTADINSTGGFLVGRNGNGDNLGDGLFQITGSMVTIDGGDLRVGLNSDPIAVDQGAMGEVSWIADAGGVSTIFTTDNTEFGANADLTVDLTADSAFSTWTSTPMGALIDIAVLVDNVNSVAGTFTGLAEGAAVSIGGGQTAFITYVGGDGNDIILQAYAVPEPTSATILALAGMGMMFRRRRN